MINVYGNSIGMDVVNGDVNILGLSVRLEFNYLALTMSME